MMSKAFEESYSKLKSMNIQDIKNALAEAERNFEKCTEPFTSQDIIKQQQETINRQKAEIERLKKLLAEADITYNKCAKRFYKEGVTELAERLKVLCRQARFSVTVTQDLTGIKKVLDNIPVVDESDIDNLVKEMAGADGG